MADWVKLSFSDLVPDSLQTIFDEIDTILGLVEPPYNAVIEVLRVAKTFLLSADAFNITSLLTDYVNEFKKNYIGSGFYLCNMYDYPIKQLYRMNTFYGPDQDYSQLNLFGDTFRDSFLQDLANSLSDIYDYDRPKFTGRCAMLVFFLSGSNIDEIRIYPEEGGISNTWKALGQSLKRAGTAAHAARFRASFAKMKIRAQLESAEKSSAAYADVDKAFKLLSKMDNEDIAVLPVPVNPVTGERFFEDQLASELSWEQDIVPVLDAIQKHFSRSAYPDWRRVSLREIYPDIVDIIDYACDAILELMRPARTISLEIVEYIKAIEAKIAQIKKVTDQIDRFFENVDEFLSSEGFYGALITSDNGINDLKSQLIGMTGEPRIRGFYAGMAIVAGGDVVDPFINLFGALV